jgi:hypothetical protein
MGSIFTRPRRQIQAATSSSMREYPVTSFDEVMAAISVIQKLGATGDYAAAAACILQVAPFRVERSIVIPVECVGLTFKACSRLPITAGGVVDTLFDVRAKLVTIRDLFCASESTTDMFTTFVTCGSGGADLLRVLDNYVVADRVYVESASNDPNDVIIRGNQQSEVNNAHAAPIVIHGGRARVVENTLADGGGDGITVGAGGDFVAIIGNDLRGADITTTASDGENTIVGNNNVTTLTLHANDEEAANTP